MRMRYFVIF